MFGRRLTPEEKYMKAALKEANKAYRDDDVPIGCIIVNQDGKVIAKAHNRRNRDGSTLSHAEILAIGQACKKVKDWRLEGCTMYVTLEPCQMCAGAIVQARMDRVVIGCMNKKAGCCGSVINLLQMPQFNHQVEIVSGIMQEECSSIISDFFKELREEKQQLKTREADANQTLNVDEVNQLWQNASADETSPIELPAAASKKRISGTTITDSAESTATGAGNAGSSSSASAAGPSGSGKDLSDTDKLLAMDDLLLAALAEDGDNEED